MASPKYPFENEPYRQWLNDHTQDVSDLLQKMYKTADNLVYIFNDTKATSMRNRKRRLVWIAFWKPLDTLLTILLRFGFPIRNSILF